MDSSLRIRHAGIRIRALMGEELIGAKFIDFFTILRPKLQFNWKEVWWEGGLILMGEELIGAKFIDWFTILRPKLQFNWKEVWWKRGLVGKRFGGKEA